MFENLTITAKKLKSASKSANKKRGKKTGLYCMFVISSLLFLTQIIVKTKPTNTMV